MQSVPKPAVTPLNVVYVSICVSERVAVGVGVDVDMDVGVRVCVYINT